MKPKVEPVKQLAEDVNRDIRRATRRHFSAEEKIRIVLDGLRGDESISEIYRREGIASLVYYVSMAERKCARWRRKSVPVRFREKGRVALLVA